MLNPKSIAYTKAHMLGNVSVWVCVCVCRYVCPCMYVECACDSVGVRSCGLKMDNKKLIATNSCAIFCVRLETLYPEENRWQPERGGEALGVGGGDMRMQHETMFTFYSFPWVFHVFRPFFAPVLFWPCRVSLTFSCLILCTFS